MKTIEIEDGQEPEGLTSGKLEAILVRLEALNDIEIGAELDFIRSLATVEQEGLGSDGIQWKKMALLFWSRETDSEVYVRQLHQRYAVQLRRARQGERLFSVATKIKKIVASEGGKAKAANAKPNPEREKAIKYAREHPGLSAMQIKTRAKLRASDRTIRQWLSAAC